MQLFYVQRKLLGQPSLLDRFPVHFYDGPNVFPGLGRKQGNSPGFNHLIARRRRRLPRRGLEQQYG